MRAWPGEGGDVMGPTVTRTGSTKTNTPPSLKNGSDLRESGYLIAVGSRTARFRRKHKNKLLILIVIACILFLLSLSIAMTVLYIKQKRHRSIRICESKECLRSAANLAISMDTTVDPCHDFYKYVCGKWSEDHPRPDAYRSYDWFRDKQTKVYSIVRDFLGRNTSDQPRPVQQAKDMYSACMDTKTLDKLGLKPVFKILELVGLPHYPTYLNSSSDFDYTTYKFDWLDVIIKIKTLLGMDVIIGFDIFTDPKNSSVYRLVMGSPETTNPFPSLRKNKNRYTGRKSLKSLSNKSDKETNDDSVFNSDHYFEANEQKSDDDHDDDEEQRLAEIYKLFYAQLIKLFYVESDHKDLNITERELDENIIATSSVYYTIEKDIHELDETNETDIEDNDVYLTIPDYTVDEAQQRTDAIVEINNGTVMPIWRKYLEGVFSVSETNLDFDNDKIMISEPDMRYMGLIASYVSKTPPAILELYIWVKVVEVTSVHTTTDLRNIFQHSYDSVKHKDLDIGTPPRSLVCANAVNDMLGLAVSYAIADSHFLNITKPKVQTMLNELKNALADLVGRTKWMDDDTKLATYQKIVQMKTLIGFPDWLLEEGRLEEYYKGIKIDANTHLQNMINIIQEKIKNALNKFREGNNFTWATDPTEVNAYHTFQENTITIPLVMLQYPFFDLGLDSLNYGSLGTVLGHEITHGFDNFGRQFDKNGNLLPWWSNNTIQSFVNLTQCFVKQYSNFYVAELDEHVDGKKTLGENIADNGGLREALAALKHHLKRNGPEEKLPGFENFTSEQMFFLSFGNLWCGVSTKESLRSDLEDEHSPQIFRAQGALQNNEDFSKAWHCSPGSPMNPSQKCIIF